jgi:hypothetical protein
MHYCHMTDEQIRKLSLPKLNALLARIDQHVEFTVKLAGGEIEEEHEATEADITQLEMMFGGR